jgi:WD40 repeat protein
MPDYREATGRELMNLQGMLTERIQRAVFSSDGQHMVAVSHDGLARVWNAGCPMSCSLAELQEFAQSRVIRQHTPEERAQFLHIKVTPNDRIRGINRKIR